VIGGRGSALGSTSRRIVAVDPSAHRIWTAGRLDTARSDLAAATVGRRIVLAGGLGAGGTEAHISKLTPQAVPAAHVARRKRVDPTATSPNVYASDRANHLTGAARFARPLVYVPNSDADTVDVIDPHTFRVVEHFAVGGLPQHVVPSWGSADALRHERRRKQPDSDRPTHGPARSADPGRRSLQPLLHARRSVRDRRRRAVAATGLP
jgi:YVTN family beta-propeller protein